MKVTSNLSGRGSLNVVQKQGGQGQEAKKERDDNQKQQQKGKRLSTSNRMSLDLQQQQNQHKKNLNHHQRNRSDLQNPRKNVATSLQNVQGDNQNFIQSYQNQLQLKQQQNAFLTCSNSSIDGMSGNTIQQSSKQYHNQAGPNNLILGEDFDIIDNYPPQQIGNMPQSVKSLNRLSKNMEFVNGKTQKQMEDMVSNSIDSNLAISAVLAAKYHSAVQSNYQESRHNSIGKTNSIEMSGQVIGNRRQTANFTLGERLSQDGTTFLAMNHAHSKLHGSQIVDENHQPTNNQMKLKSAASSPSLHSFNQIKNSYIQSYYPVSSLFTSSATQSMKKQVQNFNTNANTHQIQNNIFNFSNSNINPSSQSLQQQSKILNQNQNEQNKQGQKQMISATVLQSGKSKPLTTKKQKNVLNSQMSQQPVAAFSLGPHSQVLGEKKVVSTATSSQQHKRSTSDGTSLNKMFHFKQQMLINKIFKQQSASSSQSSSEVINNLQKNQANLKTAQGQEKLNKKPKKEKLSYGGEQKQIGTAQIMLSSLSSKRQSSEENQENLRFNCANYQTLREQNPLKNSKVDKESKKVTKNGIEQQQQAESRLSQEMRSILNKFKTKESKDETTADSQLNKQPQSMTTQHLDHKQKLIQAITLQQQQVINSKSGQARLKSQPESEENSYLVMSNGIGAQNFGYQQDGFLYSGQVSNLNSNQKDYQTDFRSLKGDYTEQNYQTAKIGNENPSSRKQSDKIMNAHQINQSHKRAKSDATKHLSQQTQSVSKNGNDYTNSNNYRSKAQQLIDTATVNQAKKTQKMFFLNLQEPAQRLQQDLLSNQMNQFNTGHMGKATNYNFDLSNGGVIQMNPQQMPYSARASPTMKQSADNLYYLTNEDYNLNLGGLIGACHQQMSKPLIATARSESSNKMLKNTVGKNSTKQVHSSMSNQTTIKKTVHQNQPIQHATGGVVNEHVNTRLVYPDSIKNEFFYSKSVSSHQQQLPSSIIHSQQFNKLSSILYGEPAQQQHQSAQAQNRVMPEVNMKTKPAQGNKDQRHKRIESASNFLSSQTEDLRLQDANQRILAQVQQLKPQRQSQNFQTNNQQQQQVIFEYNQSQKLQRDQQKSQKLNCQLQNARARPQVNLEIDLCDNDFEQEELILGGETTGANQQYLSNGHYQYQQNQLLQDQQQQQNLIRSLNQSPKLKMMPTPKLNQPGGPQTIQNFYQGLFAPLQQSVSQTMGQNCGGQIINNGNLMINANFMISPLLQQQQQKLMQQQKSSSDKGVVQTEQDENEVDGDEEVFKSQIVSQENSQVYGGRAAFPEDKFQYGKPQAAQVIPQAQSSSSKQPLLFSNHLDKQKPAHSKAQSISNANYLTSIQVQTQQTKRETTSQTQQMLSESQKKKAQEEQKLPINIQENDLDGGNQFQTFESNLTTHGFNNLTPRSRDKYKIIKQIKNTFVQLQEPPKTTPEYYRIGKMLGKGAFGRVNLAIHKLCCQLVAVKSISKQFLSEAESEKKKLVQEVQILQKTRHENIVRLYDSFETNKQLVFVMELCAGGDLLNYVRKRRKLKEPVAKYVFKQVAQGLHYCHQKGIVHRDMKLDNLLFDEQGVVKICDFGVSKQLASPSEIMTEQCGTPAYIAPEILKDKGYKGFGVDIWSLGVCLYAMLFGTVPFKANNMNELHQLILKAKFTFKEGDLKPGEQPLSDDVKALIKAILEPNPEKRISMQAILNHKWLEEDPEEPKIEIFTEQELETIRKDFTYQDMSRYKRNLLKKKKILQQQMKQQLTLEAEPNNNPLGLPASAIVPGYNGLGIGGAVTTEENLFTEHALDSTQNVLMRNASTKSVILAPFNSTRTHIAREDLDQDLRPFGSQDNCREDEDSTYIPPLPIDPSMIVDKRIIKYAPRVKDINRQYEMNNNCELDNGVYNKFVKQSTERAGEGEDNLRSGCSDQSIGGGAGAMGGGSLILTMNGDCQENLLEQEQELRKQHKAGESNQQYAAPLVSQNSDVGELVAVNNSEKMKIVYPACNFLKNNLKTGSSVDQEESGLFKCQKDEPVQIDEDVVEKVTHFGYPKQYVMSSLQQYELNDATANYFLLEKEKQVIEDLQNNMRFYQ